MLQEPNISPALDTSSLSTVRPNVYALPPDPITQSSGIQRDRESTTSSTQYTNKHKSWASSLLPRLETSSLLKTNSNDYVHRPITQDNIQCFGMRRGSSIPSANY